METAAPMPQFNRGDKLRASSLNEMVRRTRTAGGGSGGYKLDAVSVPGIGQASRTRVGAIRPDVHQGKILIGSGNKITVGEQRGQEWYKQVDTITVVNADGSVTSKDMSDSSDTVTVTDDGFVYYDVTLSVPTATLEFSDTWPPVVAAGHVPVMVGTVTWDADTSKIIRWYQALYHNPTVYASTTDTDVLVKVSANDTTAGYLKDKSVTEGTFDSGETVGATDTPLAYETLNPAADEDLALAFDIDHLTEITSLNTGDWFIVSQQTADQSRKIDRENLITDLGIPGAGAAIAIVGGNINLDIDKQAVDNTMSLTDWVAYEQSADNAIKACTVQGVFDTINVLNAETAVATGDKFAMYDASGTAADAITAANLIDGLLKIISGYNASNLQVVANDSGTIKFMETIDLEDALELFTGFGASKTFTSSAASVIGWT